MPGRIRFEYRSLYDVVIAHVDWQLETMEDIDIWYRQYETYFKPRFSRKVALILELSKFRLHPRLTTQYREIRNRILSEFTTSSYRVKAPAKQKTIMYTGFVLAGGPANQFDSIEDALKALLADRVKESGTLRITSKQPAGEAGAGVQDAQPRSSNRPR